jgi:6-pyruvoyltetrahydropterin/6-carboxytetrahydropterin synthase
VTVSGKLNEETGYLVDLKDLSKIIEEEVEDKFDHKNLNLDTEEFKSLNPTAENIAVVIWRLLRARISSDLKIKITL